MPWNFRPPLVPMSRRRRDAIRLSAGAIAIVAMTGTILLAQPQPTPDDKGKARVVERRGPEVDVRANAAGQVVVLFPQNGDRTAVEVTIVESQLPAPAAAGQPAPPQTATPTGKEFVFSSKDARDQTVAFKLDANGNPRKLMLLAKIDGKMAEVRPAGGPEGVGVFTIAMPEVPKPPEAPKSEGDPAAAPAPPPAPPAQAAVIVFYSGAIAP